MTSRSDTGAERVPVDGLGRFTLVDPPRGAVLRAPFARAAVAIDDTRDDAELVLEVPPGSTQISSTHSSPPAHDDSGRHSQPS